VITLVDRYVGRYILGAAALTLAVLAALLGFAVLLDALPDYGRGGFGMYELARYVLLSQPRRLYEIFPVAALIGTLLGLAVLARNSELIALRASGFSAVRLAGSAFKSGLVLIAAAVVFGEFIVPVAETEAQMGRARALASGLRTSGSGLWLRDGPVFLNAGEVLPGQQLLRVSLYDFGEAPCAQEGCTDRRLRVYLYARSANLAEGEWVLHDVEATRFTESGTLRERQHTLRRPTGITPQVLDAFSVRPEGLSMLNLYRYARYLEGQGQDARRYRLALWQKILLPLAVAVMTLLAIPFVLRPVRSGGLGGRVFLGVMLGLAFILASRSFGYLGLLYGLPPLAGSLAPILLFFGVGLVLLRRVR
jgi:lipopolysaccharide export system permease protein